MRDHPSTPLTGYPVRTDAEMVAAAAAFREHMARRRTVREFSDRPVPRPVVEALSITPAYLRNAQSEAGAVVDLRDWQVPLGRRFRALKPWFVMRHYGSDGLARHVREHVRLARLLADRVLADPGFELAAPPALNLVVLRCTGDDADARTSALLDAVNASGRALLTGTVLDGRPAIRICVGQTWTTEAHVEALWELLRELRG